MNINSNISTGNSNIVMDVEQLHVILQQSFASEANIRQPAEEIIRHLKHIHGATVLLLQVVSEKQVRISKSFYICVHEKISSFVYFL
jgi:hypothetical protein